MFARLGLTSQQRSCIVADMSKPTDRPEHDPAHTDQLRERLRFADAAEALLRSILETLGYSAPVTTEALLTGITAWLALLQQWAKDPTGTVAAFWAKTFHTAFAASPMASPKTRREDAADEATAAAAEYMRRFPPLVEDAPNRDTVDDIDAMRAELDAQTETSVWAADAARKAEAEQQRLLGELESIGDTLNEAAVALEAASLSDVPDAAKRIKAEHRTYLDLLGDAAEALDVGPLQDIPNAAQKLRALADAAEASRDEREATIAMLETELVRAKVELAEVKRGVFAPQPRPDRVDAGQRWALLVTAGRCDSFANKQEWLIGYGLNKYSFTLPQNIDPTGDVTHYIGAAPNTEA